MYKDKKLYSNDTWSMWPCMRPSLIILLAVRSAFSAESDKFETPR
jgi:hypothetical protein